MNVPFTRLPLSFDPAGLHADLEAIAPAAWSPHLSERLYTGACSAVALRSRSGTSDDLAAWGGAQEFRDTPLAALCPHLMAAADALQFAKKAVHLVRLSAGSRLRECRASELGIAHGELRIHIPVAMPAGDDVEMIAANRCLAAREGESWYVALAEPFRILNHGAASCAFLVIDGVVNDWTATLLQRAARETVSESSDPRGAASFHAFREKVFDDTALQAKLVAITPPGHFFDAVVAAGAELGFTFDSIDVASALNRSRHEWMMRTVAL